MLKRALWSALFLSLIATPVIAQKRCVKGKPCGNTCIAATKTCRVGTGTATRATTPTSSVAVAIPEGMQFVASTRGTTYYAVGCSGWRSLAAANLRWFKTVEDAQKIGLKPSTQPGCAGSATAPALAGPTTSPPGSCAVSRIVDGDTIECGGGTTVRLLLVDAPEMNQGPFGATAKLHLEELAPVGTVLALEQDVEKQDRYGRTLAHLKLPDGRSVNEALLRAGMAVVSVYPPNVMHVERYRAVSDSAQAARVGLWAASAFECLPADYRAGRCR